MEKGARERGGHTLYRDGKSTCISFSLFLEGNLRAYKM